MVNSGSRRGEETGGGDVQRLGEALHEAETGTAFAHQSTLESREVASIHLGGPRQVRLGDASAIAESAHRPPERDSQRSRERSHHGW